MRARLEFAACLITMVALPFTGYADEPIFGYVYGTDLLPRHGWETEQWVSVQEGQSRGRYANALFRLEVEHGITDKLQISGYFNFRYVSANGNDVLGGTSGLGIDGDHDPSRAFSAWKNEGISLELIYRVLSPYKSPIGLAFYAEPELKPDEDALELRAILQKGFLDDTLVLAANLMFEPEREKKKNEEGNTEIEHDTKAELDLGLSYRLAPRWFLGGELREANAFSGYTLAHGNQEHTALFLGPTIHYGGERWFATLTILRQIYADAFTDDQRQNTVDHKIYGDEHTLYDGIRLKIGRTF